MTAPSASSPRSGRQEANLADWRVAAVCAGVDPDLWHPDTGVSDSAPRICREICPVRAHCLVDALVGGVRGGTWGGVLGGHRRKIQSEFNQQQPGDPLQFAKRAIIKHDQQLPSRKRNWGGESCVA